VEAGVTVVEVVVGESVVEITAPIDDVGEVGGADEVLPEHAAATPRKTTQARRNGTRRAYPSCATFAMVECPI
jgi:hypothetical protein